MTTEQEVASTRVAYGQALADIGHTNSDIIVLDADLAKSTQTILFGKEHPDRFFYVGISEQNMMSMAAGLAANGKTVFASTFAVFATGRAFDQVRIGISWPELNVKIVASHGGISVGEDGASAQSIEDYALMSSLPSFRVVIPADAYAVKKAIPLVAAEKGPFYVRTHRPATPVVYTSDNCPFEIGKANTLRDGDDATIIAVGILVHEAVAAAELLQEKDGISCRVLDMHTLKPMDVDAVTSAAKDTGAIVTAEDHQIQGGLGSGVARIVAERYPVPVEYLGMHGYGTSGPYLELMQHFDFTPEAIREKVKNVIARKEG